MEYTPALDYPHTGALLISSLRLGPEARKKENGGFQWEVVSLQLGFCEFQWTWSCFFGWVEVANI